MLETNKSIIINDQKPDFAVATLMFFW